MTFLKKIAATTSANIIDNETDYVGLEEIMRAVPEELSSQSGDRTNLLRALENLIREDWLEKSEQAKYRFRIDLLRLWLRREHTIWHLEEMDVQQPPRTEPDYGFLDYPSTGKSGTGHTENIDLSGIRIGRFIVKELLGSGAMGNVYLAEDTVLKHAVALKRVISCQGFIISKCGLYCLVSVAKLDLNARRADGE